MIRRTLLGLMIAAVPMLTHAQDNALPRPKLLAATGLVTTQTIEHSVVADAPSPLPFEVTLTSSDTVTARFNPEVDGALAAVEFAGPGNTFVESIILTAATAEAGTPEDRDFAIANLLVLRTFPSLIENFPDARILGFSRVDVGNGVPAVQVVGTYTNGPLGPTVFRHIGFLKEGQAEVLIALVNISSIRMPSRTQDDLDNTYSALALRSLKLLD